jgi:hypothetical protein
LTGIALASLTVHEAVTLQRLQSTQQRGSIHDQSRSQLSHGHAALFVQQNENGILRARDLRTRQMPLVKARDMAGGLPRREAITEIKVSGFSHVLTICMHIHIVNALPLTSRPGTRAKIKLRIAPAQLVPKPYIERGSASMTSVTYGQHCGTRR